ncbi:hypothetical protein BDW62DRAFT_203313 [Aspergillus aurantiobrunneus]
MSFEKYHYPNRLHKLFKIVALGIGNLSNDPNASEADTGILCESLTPHVEFNLWMPHPPAYDDIEFSALQPSMPTRLFEPLVSIDFGGPGGLLLSSLKRLVFYMGPGTHHVIGLEVFYADGSSFFFGTNWGCELSFPIDGPNGERVNGISTLNYVDSSLAPGEQGWPGDRGVCGLQVSTNSGRTVTFAPIKSRLRPSIDWIRNPDPNQVITGFLALQMQPGDPFLRLGIQHQPCANPPPSFEDPSIKYVMSDDILPYDLEFLRYISRPGASDFQTCATLKGVRRIRASTGIDGRCRNSNRISGLKFEYYHGTPAIVGQWMNEHDVFELSPNETIDCITIWITPLADSGTYPTIRLGQVSAIRIQTTQARAVLFRAPNADPLSETDMQHQYGSGYTEELVRIPLHPAKPVFF